MVDRIVINPARLSLVHALSEPYAYKLSPEVCVRLDDYPRSGLVDINRSYNIPPELRNTYGVRVDEKVVLYRVF